MKNTLKNNRNYNPKQAHSPFSLNYEKIDEKDEYSVNKHDNSYF
jgi:hypothetical protein